MHDARPKEKQPCGLSEASPGGMKEEEAHGAR